ncbi:hypothetical protein Anapl_17307 [Anas platyrhynchos]|uniref:Uncharacterized protein n=1 Tax=Anas platyrhynchos TaxID=8839 RepID=R0KSC7_ANAPL|nr:hypothetical protein Anapl_17307 [Anas platyrhynchos]
MISVSLMSPVAAESPDELDHQKGPGNLANREENIPRRHLCPVSSTFISEQTRSMPLSEAMGCLDQGVHMKSPLAHELGAQAVREDKVTSSLVIKCWFSQLETERYSSLFLMSDSRGRDQYVAALIRFQKHSCFDVDCHKVSDPLKKLRSSVNAELPECTQAIHWLKAMLSDAEQIQKYNGSAVRFAQTCLRCRGSTAYLRHCSTASTSKKRYAAAKIRNCFQMDDAEVF